MGYVNPKDGQTYKYKVENITIQDVCPKCGKYGETWNRSIFYTDNYDNYLKYSRAGYKESFVLCDECKAKEAQRKREEGKASAERAKKTMIVIAVIVAIVALYLVITNVIVPRIAHLKSPQNTQSKNYEKLLEEWEGATVEAMEIYQGTIAVKNAIKNCQNYTAQIHGNETTKVQKLQHNGYDVWLFEINDDGAAYKDLNGKKYVMYDPDEYHEGKGVIIEITDENTYVRYNESANYQKYSMLQSNLMHFQMEYFVKANVDECVKRTKDDNSYGYFMQGEESLALIGDKIYYKTQESYVEVTLNDQTVQYIFDATQYLV